MNCRYHKGVEAKYVCEKCKQPICEECMIDINGRYICKSCTDSMLSSSDNRKSSKKSFIREFLFFCFSLIPGAAHMSMGLFKRGVQLMVTTFGAFALLTYFNTEQLIAVVCLPFWFFSFFDGYNIRKQRAEGNIVEDEEVYSYYIFLKNKNLLGVGLLMLGLLGFVNSLPSSMFKTVFGIGSESLYWTLRRSMIPLFLIVFGSYLLLKSRKKEIKD